MAISAGNEKWNVIYFFKLDDHYFLSYSFSSSILYYRSTIYIFDRGQRWNTIINFLIKCTQACTNLTFIKRQDYLMDQTFPHFH